MSTEPNTQPEMSPILRTCFVCKELGATVFHGFVTHRLEDWRHRDCFPTRQPPPETGAVDVESYPFIDVIAYNAAAEIARNTDAASVGQRWLFEEYIREQQLVILKHVVPLTARISELERTLETVTKGSFEASQAMAAVNAELRSRVKEMEEKLEGALKLTTANSIEHVSKLER